MIIVFLNTGVRISELTNLDISDINFCNKTIRIIGKGNKERIIPLNSFMVGKLREYLEQREDSYKALFITNRGKRISNKAVENICKKAFELIGLNNKEYSAHTLRHTAAMIMYNQTKDMLITREFLGHESIASTQIYAIANADSVKEAINKNPLNKFQIQMIGERGE